MTQPRLVTCHIDLAFPTNYVKAADLKGKDATVRVVCVENDALVMAGGKKEFKNILTMESLAGQRLGKKLVLNKTNARIIAGQHGPIMGNWTGKEITLYPTTTKCGREIVECVRVRGRVTRNAEEIPEDMAREPEPAADFVPDDP